MLTEREVAKLQAEVERLQGEAATAKDAITAHEATAKDAADKLAALQAAHDEATAKIATLEASLAGKELEALRATVAAEFRLCADDLVLLTGGDRGALEAQAKRIAALSQIDGSARQNLDPDTKSDMEILADKLRQSFRK
ncbi:MAG: hypothetical protein FWG25_10880 [Promicromonosporaceae bacterium]|nr:hypothetical protein [Promicromonosporaceae bacterium]